MPGHTPRSTSNPNCEVGMMRCIDEYFLHHVNPCGTTNFSALLLPNLLIFSQPDSSGANAKTPKTPLNRSDSMLLERAIRSAVITVKRRSLPLGVGAFDRRAGTNAEINGHRSMLRGVQSFIVIVVEVVVLRHMNFLGKILPCAHAYHRNICF